MKNNLASVNEWALRTFLSLFLKKYYIFDKVKLEVKNIEANGLILDIGGGGEGVIGRLKGGQVVAIDLQKDELDGISDGPQKVVMDARQIGFPDNSFGAATAFFSMMYIKTIEDHQQVMKQTWHVIRPAGRLFLWDIDLAERPYPDKDFYFVRLRYRVGDFEKETGYGVRRPNESRDEAYYIRLAREAGFSHLTTERIAHVFYLEFIKPD
jgi:ubiquinone/menaquinone biosynthesis C-methylase UbiE